MCNCGQLWAGPSYTQGNSVTGQLWAGSTSTQSNCVTVGSCGQDLHALKVIV